MEKKTFTIWSNFIEDCNEEEWKAELEEHLRYDTDLDEEDIQAKLSNEDEVFDYWNECNNDYIDDERFILNNKHFDRILIIADLGLWDGRKLGYKVCVNKGLGDMLYDEDCDYAKWYVDEADELRFDGAHHDGRNHYLYRIVKPETSDNDLHRLCELIYNGADYSKWLDKLTTKAGAEVRELYGC